jgi:hypothetical protein
MSNPNQIQNRNQSGFIVTIVGEMVTKGSFASRGSERRERMTKDWANKDMYNPSHGVPESRMPLPRGKAIVRTVPTWGDNSALGGRDPAGGIKSARPVWAARTAKPVRPVPEPVRPV